MGTHGGNLEDQNAKRNTQWRPTSIDFRREQGFYWRLGVKVILVAFWGKNLAAFCQHPKNLSEAKFKKKID